MTTETQIDTLCGHVAQAVQQIRATFRSNFQISEMMDRFWALQDHLHRLLEALYDDRSELPRLKEAYPRLTKDVVDILSFTAGTYVGKVPAVKESCYAINELLLGIGELKSPVAMVASL